MKAQTDDAFLQFLVISTSANKKENHTLHTVEKLQPKMNLLKSLISDYYLYIFQVRFFGGLPEK